MNPVPICDAPGCGQPADAIYVIPDSGHPREIKLGCPKHTFTPGGQVNDLDGNDSGVDAYRFTIERWESGEMEKHIRQTKAYGDFIAKMISARLAV